jgi:hypothetical protein
LRDDVELCIFGSREKGVLWMMTMFLGTVARNAEIEVLAGCARNEVFLREFYEYTY